MPVGTLRGASIVVLILGVLGGHTAANAVGGEPFMTTAGRTAQPIGHYEFCQRYADECNVKSRDGARVRLTPDLWAQLVAVNDTVNRTVVPTTDEVIFGREEVWSYPAGFGDCEDIALLKRRTLIAKGWPVGALLITVVRQRNGEGHAILTVLTDRGDLVLDNLDPRVRVWSDTSYQFVKRQSQFNTGQWATINDGRATSVGSLSR